MVSNKENKSNQTLLTNYNKVFNARAWNKVIRFEEHVLAAY